MASSAKNPAVFLDRDGTVAEETGYMYDESLFRIFPWTGPAIRRMNDSGMYVILATNQSGVERGYFEAGMVDRVHTRLRSEIGKSGGRLDAAYYCPHHPDTRCLCRKPNPGMLLRARDELGIDLAASYMVGDRYTDIRTGKAAGTRTVLVLTGDGHRELETHREGGMQPDHVARDLAEAAEIILRETGTGK